MGSLSIWHWIVFLIFVVGTPVGIAALLKKTGRSPWWALFYFIPVVNIALLLVWAFSGKNPVEDQMGDASTQDERLRKLENEVTRLSAEKNQPKL